MKTRNWQQYFDSLRGRLVALTLFPLLLVLPGVILLAYLWSNEVGYRQLLMKANTDLAVAHETFVNTRTQHLVRLSLSANDYRFRADLTKQLQAPSATTLDHLQQRLEQASGFDFVRILSPDGCPIFGECFYPKTPLFKQAQSQGAASGVEIFSHIVLQKSTQALQIVPRYHYLTLKEVHQHKR